MKNSNSGFTIIELVVVIVILGILAAVALPKFMDAAERAHDASFVRTAGSFETSVNLAKTQWFVNGNSNGDPENDVDGYGDGSIDVTGGGWPYAVSANNANHVEFGREDDNGSGKTGLAASNQECANLFMAVVNGQTATAFTGLPLNTDFDYAAATISAGTGVRVNGDNPATREVETSYEESAPAGCQYAYTADQSTDLYPESLGYRRIIYNYRTGVVSHNVILFNEEGGPGTAPASPAPAVAGPAVAPIDTATPTPVAEEEPTVVKTTEEPTIARTTEDPTVVRTTEEPTVVKTTEEPTVVRTADSGLTRSL